MLLFWIFLSTAPLSAADPAARDLVKTGNDAFRNGRFEDALAAYQRALSVAPGSPEVLFNIGNVLYRQRKFSEADALWASVADKTTDKALVASCRYNQANAAYQVAAGMHREMPQQALELLERAAQAYTVVLDYNPRLGNARYNRDAAQEFIRRLQARLARFDTSQPSPEDVLQMDVAGRSGRGSRKRSGAGKDW